MNQNQQQKEFKTQLENGDMQKLISMQRKQQKKPQFNIQNKGTKQPQQRFKPFDRNRDRTYEMLKNLPFDTPGPVTLPKIPSKRITMKLNPSNRPSSMFDQYVEQNNYKQSPSQYSPVNQATQLTHKFDAAKENTNEESHEVAHFNVRGQVVLAPNMMSAQYYNPQEFKQETKKFKMYQCKRKTIFDLNAGPLERMLGPATYRIHTKAHSIVGCGPVRKTQIQ